RVRLRPRKGGDILDSEFAGRTGAIESIEQDYEDRIHLAVVLDDDPGRDLGLLRLPGHRFFFSPEEVEPLRPEEKEKADRWHVRTSSSPASATSSWAMTPSAARWRDAWPNACRRTKREWLTSASEVLIWLAP